MSGASALTLGLAVVSILLAVGVLKNTKRLTEISNKPGPWKSNTPTTTRQMTAVGVLFVLIAVTSLAVAVWKW